MGRVTAHTLTEYEDIDQVTIADYNEERAHEVRLQDRDEHYWLYVGRRVASGA